MKVSRDHQIGSAMLLNAKLLLGNGVVVLAVLAPVVAKWC